MSFGELNFDGKNFSELLEFRLIDRGPIKFHFENISNLSDRDAMGLPGHYISGTLDDLKTYFVRLSSLPIDELISIAENPLEEFRNRFVAGQLLSLKGDTRINCFDPLMISINAWSGFLGLDPKEIDRVQIEFNKYGVRREWIEKESPKYFANIKSFKISKFPVTNIEYLQFLKETKHEEIPSSWAFGQFPLFNSNHPVYSISAESAIKYAVWLSNKTDRKFRLPTEAEWEYAAGGPSQNEYPWGDHFLKDCANTLESGIFQTTTVGLFPAGNSPFGCADMAGNVEEFVLDFYSGYQDTKTVIDDLVDINGSYRVARGGSFTRFRDLARCKRRHGPNPKSIYAMGFRLAEDV